VSVPVRESPVFAAKLYAREPLPEPDAPDVMVIHDALLLAVHEQALVVDTFTERVPAGCCTVSCLGEIE